MNQEVMGLYKEHKITSPAAVSLFIQLPSSGASTTSSASIEIRHQPFFLWIQDLSKKTPSTSSPFSWG